MHEPSTAVSATSHLMERAAAFCEQQGTPEGAALATELRAQAGAPAEQSGHRDFEMCQNLLDWNRTQNPPPIRIGAEYLVGLEAFRLSQPGQVADVRQNASGLPVLVLTADQTYRVLPRELPEHMLQALALVSRWDPSDETGDDADRTAMLEGWEALLALAPELNLQVVDPTTAAPAPN
jgi:hypothetical protein